jgi:hypothetical protein
MENYSINIIHRIKKTQRGESMVGKSSAKDLAPLFEKLPILNELQMRNFVENTVSHE